MSNVPKIKGRFQQKIGTTEDWQKAHEAGFVPLEGEIIIYQDYDKLNNPAPARFKVGDGKTVIGTLPFTDHLSNAICSKGLSYKLEEGGYVVSNIGTCTDTNLIIPAIHNGLPVIAIGHAALKETTIATLILPEGLKEIRNSAFQNCGALTSIILPGTLTLLDTCAFQNCPITNVYIPGTNLRKVGSSAFSGTKLTKVTIDEGVEIIGQYAFANASLISIVLPQTLHTIEKQAITGGSLESILIPKSVQTMSETAMQLPNANIYCEAQSKPELWHTNWNDGKGEVKWGAIADFEALNDTVTEIKNDIIDLKNKTPDSSVDPTAERMLYYGDATVIPTDENLFTFTELDDGTYSIGAKNVRQLSGKIILPYKYNGKLVTEIAAGGFASHDDSNHITAITNFTIPHTIRKINNTAFARNDIPEIIIPGSCKEIGTTAFYRSKVQRLTLEEGVSKIGKSTFQECHDIIYCIIPNSINSIYANSFAVNGSATRVIYYSGTKKQFEQSIVSGFSADDQALEQPLKSFLSSLIYQGKVYYGYDNSIETTEILDSNTQQINAIQSIMSQGLVIKERALLPGKKFYIHPNSFYAAFPPSTDLALYYGDKREGDPYRNDIGLITGISSEVINGKFRSGTTIQYQGGLMKATTAIYAYFQDNTNEVDGATGAYLQWNGANDTYCPILYTDPLNKIFSN